MPNELSSLAALEKRGRAVIDHHLALVSVAPGIVVIIDVVIIVVIDIVWWLYIFVCIMSL